MSTRIHVDGTVRQNHYGSGDQPWDVIKRNGWAAEFAAGNVLKYLRRTKEPEHSLESARWYRRELLKLVVENRNTRAYNAWSALNAELSPVELERLG